MAFNLGVVKAKLIGMGGRVIESGMGTKAGQNMLRNPGLAAKRGNMLSSMMAHSDAGVAGAAKKMIMQQTIKGGLQGAAIGAGVNAGRTMGSNAWNDRPMMSGVGSAAFKGAIAGATVGSNIAPARAIMGRNSKAWRGMMGSQAVRPHVAGIARGWGSARQAMTTAADEMMSMKAARAAAAAAKASGVATP